METKLQLLTRYLGILQQTQQDLSQANSLFESLFEQHPNNTQLNLIYGNVLMLQENSEGAMEQFEIFTRENPADPSPQVNQFLHLLLILKLVVPF